ncbi:MAG: DUF1269 domain-containing protein [Geobacteraceae bacterium]
MRELIVAGFNGQFTADEVLLDLVKLNQINLVDLGEAAVAIRKADGTISIKHTSILVMADAAVGGSCGLLIGAVCLNPIMGTLVGGIIGAAVGKIVTLVEKVGIEDDFIKGIADTLTPDSSAIFVLVSKGLSDQVAKELGKFSGTLLRSSLTPESEQELCEIIKQNVKLH